MKWHSFRGRVGIAVILAAGSAFVHAAVGVTPLSYSTTFTDPSGAPQSVSFTGTASGTSLTGALTVNGAPEQVTATIGADGSVSGTLLNPEQLGAFWVNGATRAEGQPLHESWRMGE